MSMRLWVQGTRNGMPFVNDQISNAKKIIELGIVESAIVPQQRQAAIQNCHGYGFSMVKQLTLATFIPLPYSEIMSVLDVGCGTGTILRAMADSCSIRGFGIDMSENMIEDSYCARAGHT